MDPMIFWNFWCAYQKLSVIDCFSMFADGIFSAVMWKLNGTRCFGLSFKYFIIGLYHSSILPMYLRASKTKKKACLRSLLYAHFERLVLFLSPAWKNIQQIATPLYRKFVLLDLPRWCQSASACTRKPYQAGKDKSNLLVSVELP